MDDATTSKAELSVYRKRQTAWQFWPRRIEQSGDSSTPRSTANSLDERRTIWVVLLIFAAASLPLLLVRIPPIMDYPNHLARIWLLSGGAATHPMSSFYVVDWSRSATNVGVDWIAAQLGQFLSLNAVDRLLRVLMFIGPAAGTAYMGRTLHGRISIWHIAPLGFAWGTTAIAGFMSFSIALGVAAFAAATIRHDRPLLSPGPLILHLSYATTLLWLHPFGLLFYMALVVGIIIGPRLLPVGEIIAIKGPRIITFGLISLAPIALLYLLASKPPSTNLIEFGTLSITTVVKMLLSPALSY